MCSRRRAALQLRSAQRAKEAQALRCGLQQRLWRESINDAPTAAEMTTVSHAPRSPDRSAAMRFAPTTRAAIGGAACSAPLSRILGASLLQTATSALSPRRLSQVASPRLPRRVVRRRAQRLRAAAPALSGAQHTGGRNDRPASQNGGHRRQPRAQMCAHAAAAHRCGRAGGAAWRPRDGKAAQRCAARVVPCTSPRALTARAPRRLRPQTRASRSKSCRHAAPC